jgi:hypothetical protein
MYVHMAVKPKGKINVSSWHEAADPECPLFGRYWGVKRTTYAQREFFAF